MTDTITGAPLEPTIQPAISIVIPAHNASATIIAQLDGVALAAAEMPSTEIIVVDNCSSDDTALVTRAWAAAHQLDVRVIDANMKAGEGHARNVGATEARGEHLCFCDSDDIVDPRWLTGMVEGFNHSDYVTGPLDLDRLNPPWRAGARGRSGLEHPSYLWDVIPFANGCNMGFRRSTLLDVGGFDENLPIGVDLDMAIKMHEAGHSLRFEADAKISYRLRAGLRATFRQGYDYARYRVLIRRRLRHQIHIPSPLPRHLRRLVWLARWALPALWSKSIRARWVWTASHVAGEAKGAWEFRQAG